MKLEIISWITDPTELDVEDLYQFALEARQRPNFRQIMWISAKYFDHPVLSETGVVVIYEVDIEDDWPNIQEVVKALEDEI